MPRSWATVHVAERILAQLILEGDVQPDCCGKLWGGTAVMRNLYDDIGVVAPLSDPALILGETGAGKELVAGEIHHRSGRPDNLISINCAELSLELSGSDFFGHQQGSFTGAAKARRGLLAEAGRGTVFLDEIGELDLQAQAKLLRVLEDRKVRRVGTNQWEDIQARFVLATNRNLEEECEMGRFRQDLFERIRGFTLELPPLGDRRADIPLLVRHFIAEYSDETKQDLAVPPGALDCLFEYHWRGNVRELRAAVRKAAAYAKGSHLINAVRLKEATNRGRRTTVAAQYSISFDPHNDTWKELLRRTQIAYFRALLTTAGGNKEQAAKLSGISRSQFYEKLKEIETEL